MSFVRQREWRLAINMTSIAEMSHTFPRSKGPVCALHLAARLPNLE